MWGKHGGPVWIEATAEQREALRGLAGSSDREEADRARAILLSLDGWTSERIAAAFSVQPDSVRHWRWIFGRDGVAGLRGRKACGPEPVKASTRPWFIVEWLPKYAPELNDIERSWRDLKRHFLAHQTFTDTDHLDRAIHQAVANMNGERQPKVCTNQGIAA